MKFLCNGLPKLSTDWSKWRIFFCDERHVQYDSADCTYTPYKQGLVDKVGMSADNIFPINPDLTGLYSSFIIAKKMVPVVPLFSTQHLNVNTGSFSRIKIGQKK